MQRPEIGARLDHLCLRSPDAQRLERFFQAGFGVSPAIEAGEPNKAAFFAFAFPTRDALAHYRLELQARHVALLASPSRSFDDSAFAVQDAEGNVVVFGHRAQAAPSSGPLPARLQHVVFRTPHIKALVEFYERKLGFVVSDRVQDGAGVLRACFLRSDEEHHSLAFFLAAESRLDHHSYETPDWQHIRLWADHLAGRRIPIFWGVGRHGPGNDLFFMVKDPDGNLVEISAEIETCAADRPSGVWPHENRTLNLWGTAILRS